MENHLAIFLSANWENANTGQSLSSVQSLPDVQTSSPWKEFHGYDGRFNCVFEGGNLWPTSPENSATSRVVWLSCRAIFANISQIYYFVFEGTVSICIFLLQLGSMCVQHSMHGMCTHMKKKQTWPFLPEICYSKKKALFLHGPSIIITWVMQFIIFKHVV